MTDLAQQRRQRLIGIALMVGAVATFSCLDSTAKYLNHYMDTLQVVWARYTGAFILALLVSNPINRPGLMLTRRPWSILFATPFLVAVLSGPILGEWIGWRRWIAILVGFSGVLLVTRPGFGGIHPAALLSVLSAICYALYTISTRILARTDSNQTTLFYTNLVGAAVMIPIVPFVWTTPHDPLIIGLMTVAGAFASVGHYMLIAAHRRAPASTLAPFIYAQLISVLILGYFVFGNLPTAWTLAGAAIVVGSGLYILNRERKVGVQTTQTTLPPEV